MLLDVNGRAAYAYTAGSAPGNHAIVFIHGAQNDHSVWTAQARALARDGHHVLAVDLPGHGRSAGPALATVEAMAAWLQQTLNTPEPATRTRIEKAKPVAWAERPAKGEGAKDEKTADAPREPAAKPLMQPEQWTFNFGSATTQIQAEYWAGNRSVAIRQTDNGFLGTLMSLHKGVGMTVPWILLVDTLAGCLIFLSISGLWLWVMTTKRRTVGWTIFGLGSLLAIGLAISRL